MSDDDIELIERWQDRKSALIESLLGQKCHAGYHAIIPFAAGGGLDFFYYPFAGTGTAVATRELSERPDEGSSNDTYDSYELVMFSRHALHRTEAQDERTAPGRTRRDLHAILNLIAPYSAQAVLNPYETCELPLEVPDVGGRCLILDGYASCRDELVGEFGLLALIEVFRSEMDYARSRSGTKLIERLKTAGYYPYSDMDRKPVA